MVGMVLTLLLGACEKERGRPVAPDCTSYRGHWQAVLEARCVDCHGGADPAAGYSLESYAGVLGAGSDDVPNAVAGDETSLLLRAVQPGQADETHAAHAEIFDDLRLWVVECELRYSDSPIHEAGILNPHSPDFHGALLADNHWDLSLCTGCHGDAFEGGPAEAPCTTCHTEGPDACTTCHRADLRARGSHAAHLTGDDGPLSLDDCVHCHVVPVAYDSPGHLFAADGTPDPPPADVTFESLAALTPNAAHRAGPPTYVYESGTCQNVYCHGDVLGDGNAALTRPIWFDGGSGQAACGTCHGLPPSSHHPSQVECQLCHQRVAGPEQTVAAPELHVDGMVQVGHTEAGCASCHGSTANAAPPVDLLGNASTDSVTVGAHQPHVLGSSRLRGPMACGECHLEPTTFDSPGHVETPWPAEVFPGAASFESLASTRGAVPAWDRTTGRCADVYCHGGGALTADTSAGVNRTPLWTRLRQGEAACGSCHGIPPSTAPHDSSWGLSSCHDCHAGTVDVFGGIVVTGPPGARTSLHINGVVDAF
jgi:predicted CxxxxCH...CXXCH cytochrome family protein